MVPYSEVFWTENQPTDGQTGSQGSLTSNNIVMNCLFKVLPDEKLEGEPGVANALDVEEGRVGVCPVLVQRPG